jgi:hypothetical protein
MPDRDFRHTGSGLAGRATTGASPRPRTECPLAIVGAIERPEMGRSQPFMGVFGRLRIPVRPCRIRPGSPAGRSGRRDGAPRSGSAPERLRAVGRAISHCRRGPEARSRPLPAGGRRSEAPTRGRGASASSRSVSAHPVRARDRLDRSMREPGPPVSWPALLPVPAAASGIFAPSRVGAFVHDDHRFVDGNLGIRSLAKRSADRGRAGRRAARPPSPAPGAPGRGGDDGVGRPSPREEDRHRA